MWFSGRCELVTGSYKIDTFQYGDFHSSALAYVTSAAPGASIAGDSGTQISLYAPQSIIDTSLLGKRRLRTRLAAAEDPDTGVR